MSENQPATSPQQSAEGGSGNAEGRGRRQRNRRGRHRPDKRTPSDQSQQNLTAPTSPQTLEQGNLNTEQPATSESAKLEPRNGRRRQDRSKRRHSKPESSPTADATAGEASQPAPEPPGLTEDRRGSRGGRNNRSQQRQGIESADKSSADTQGATTKDVRPPIAKPVGRNSKRERVERDPNETVLQRRRNREAQDREEHEAIDLLSPRKLTEFGTVDAYIGSLRGWQREVVQKLRTIVRSQAPDATEAILWSQPVYSSNGPVVYIKAFADHVNLGFWRGNELNDAANKLVGDLPTMRHITIRHVNEVDKELFENLVRAAFRLDRDKGDATA